MREKQGEASVKAWSSVDLKGYFEATRTERAKLVQAEMDESDEHSLAVRDSALRSIVDIKVSDRGGLIGYLKSEREKLTKELSHSNDTLVRLRGAKQQLFQWYLAQATAARANAESKDALRPIFVLTGDTLDCQSSDGSKGAAWLASKPAEDQDIASALLKSLQGQCKTAKESRQKADLLAANFKGLLGDTWATLQAQQHDLDGAKAKAQELRTEFDREASTAEGNKEVAVVASGASAASSPSSKIASGAGKLKGAVAAWLNAQDAFSKQAVSKERLDRLTKLLDDLTQGKQPDAKSSQAEATALLLPQLADDLDKLAKVNSLAPQTAVLIHQQIEERRLASATRQVELAEQRVALTRALFESRIEEAVSIYVAESELPSTLTKNKLLHEAIQDLKEPKDKLRVYDSAGRLLDVLGRQRATSNRLEIAQWTVTQEQSIAYAQSNVAEYEALIGAVVSQTAEYAKGGIKPDAIKDVFNVLGILWIGNGVNK